MDLAFHRHGLTGTAAAPVDYDMLMAGLRVVQGASPAAQAESGMVADPAPNHVAELVLAGPHWAQAASALGGAFHPAQAQRCRNRLSTQMTSPFTLAFQPSFNAGSLEDADQPLNPSRSDGSV